MADRRSGVAAKKEQSAANQQLLAETQGDLVMAKGRTSTVISAKRLYNIILRLIGHHS
jgi:hypothetical protein